MGSASNKSSHKWQCLPMSKEKGAKEREKTAQTEAKDLPSTKASVMHARTHTNDEGKKKHTNSC